MGKHDRTIIDVAVGSDDYYKARIQRLSAENEELKRHIRILNREIERADRIYDNISDKTDDVIAEKDAVIAEKNARIAILEDAVLRLAVGGDI